MIPYRGGGFFTSLPPVIKNLVIINALMLLITFFTGNFMYEKFSLFYFESEFFRPYQFVTHMFMHGNFIHLFFNMYSLIIFGVVLEHVWGSQKFFLYYMVTGLGAAALHSLVLYFDYTSQVAAFEAGNQYALQNIQNLLMTPTVGASGAVFGILLAFGWLFPEARLMLIFFPVPIKARLFVLLYGVLELFLGVANFSGDNVAHFAHLGGMLFGAILIFFWKKRRI